MLKVGILLSMIVIVRSDEICCESSGDCFNDDSPFIGLNWPLPECHETIFDLWRKDINGFRRISRGHTPPEFNQYDDTVYLVHGWTGEANDSALLQIKDEFLLTETTYNVIMVAWEEGASPIYYPQAASNVRVTGSEIADINIQLNPVYSWCVGHSLGAHACGHGGKFGAMLDRITGLDPAGPNFDLPECNEDAITCRLHPSDALQVDAIHTDGRGGGTLNLLGHIDFFPNGGTGIQPGCDNLSCGHNLSIDFFRESINDDCFNSTHHQCTNQRDLPTSCIECDHLECPNMGASTRFGSGVYYLETDPFEPYCQG